MRKSRFRTGGKIGVVAVGIIVALHLFIMGCTGESKKVEQEQAKSIMVGAGAGLKPALDPVAKLFTEKTGIKVDYAYLCSAMVLTNMQLTRTGDVMVPGSQHYMDIAIEKGVIDPDSVAVAGYMIPVIAVQKGNPHNITCIEDLAKPGLKVGIGEKEALAVGRLTDKMLKELGIYEDLMKNVVLTGGSSSKLMLPLAMKNLDAEINWMATAQAFADKVDIIKIDPKKLKYSIAPIGMTTYSKNKEAAQKYLDFVASKEGHAIFAKFGFAAYFDPEKIEKIR
ncbi:MAG: molybdate ABC transporter substrate-binding protein [Thermodesulfobacteriota bacterium]|nr:molybdate ABC transporter substrate-binding protein [Thermodesulfobacteriota bacterium]